MRDGARQVFLVDAAAAPVVPGGGGPAKGRGTSLLLGYNSVPQPPTAVAFLQEAREGCSGDLWNTRITEVLCLLAHPHSCVS